jgi:anionic cell wall polymer biosynthesis LytR-Cps2A-Psr (LCP) family protein
MYSELSKWVDLKNYRSANLGADGLKLAVGEMLGLSIDYYVAFDINSLAELTDALGGVTVNVNKDIPTPDGTIPQGANTVFADGERLIAYLSSLDADDDSKRMARTRCVVYDMAQQATPTNLASQFAGLTTFQPDSFRSDVPDWLVGDLAALAMKSQSATVAGMQFVSSQEGFSASRPDFTLMRNLVQQARNYMDSPIPGAPQNIWEPQTLDNFCAFHADAGW